MGLLIRWCYWLGWEQHVSCSFNLCSYSQCCSPARCHLEQSLTECVFILFWPYVFRFAHLHNLIIPFWLNICLMSSVLDKPFYSCITLIGALLAKLFMNYCLKGSLWSFWSSSHGAFFYFYFYMRVAQYKFLPMSLYSPDEQVATLRYPAMQQQHGRKL